MKTRMFAATRLVALGACLALFSVPLLAQDGWQNGSGSPPIGDPGAKRAIDRPLRVWWSSFPPTLRRQGPNTRLQEIFILHSLIYETLLEIHPETEELIPVLAKEWKIEVDEESGTQTFWFRIDPEARFSDGQKVTARDVYWSWWHYSREDRNDPSNMMIYAENFEEPVIVDELTIKVTCKELNWRLLLYFGGSMLIYPEKYIHIDGKTFLEEYNWRMMPGSGPYMLKPEDLKKGQSMTITRRKDWWAEDKPLSKNTFNFAKIKFVPIRDRELEYEKFKAGDLDFFQVSRAQRWAEEIPKEKVVKQGWVQRRRIYNNSPEGFNGFVFNMRKKPFDDRRVRLAFCHLFNRELLMEKLFFNQYTLMDSYFPGRDWGNGAGNPKIRFDPDRAEELLWEAGYRERNEEGILIGPDKKPLELTLEYESPAWTRIWLVVLEAYEEAGIKINLKLIDRSTRVKKIGDRQFRLHYQWWTGLLFPNPETSWRSDLADQKQNNNLPGFKNARVDELLTVYDRTFDRTEQKKITREIDSIIFNQHPYALGWYANFKRILYWDRFGHPPSYFTRIGDSAAKEIILTWWFDPEKEKRLDLAMEAGEALPQGAEDVRPWARPQK